MTVRTSLRQATIIEPPTELSDHDGSCRRQSDSRRPSYSACGDGFDPDLSLTGEAAMSAFVEFEGRNMAALLDRRRRRAA